MLPALRTPAAFQPFQPIPPSHRKASGSREPTQPPLPAARRPARPCTHKVFGGMASPPAAATPHALPHGVELDDDFTGLACDQGLMTIAGFGSLLSERSARSTFPGLTGFRLARVRGWRRVFAHACDIFYARGIARPETGEVSSLSVEEHPESAVVVSLFEVEASPESVAAFIQREHEFRFVAVRAERMDGSPDGRTAVICARWTDEAYRSRRCPPEEWARRYGAHGVDRIWRDDGILPCRVYMRHCVLAARGLGAEAHNSFLDATVLADRRTSAREWLARNPGIMEEAPPASLADRYGG